MHISKTLKRFTTGLMAVGIGVTSLLTLLPQSHASAQTAPNTLNPVPMRELYTKPNQSYLYSSSWSEVTSAQKSYGLTMPSQRAFGYVFQNQSADTKPIWRLKQKSNGAWLMSVSQSEVNSLTGSGKFTLEGVTGYIYTSAQYGAQQVNRYSNASGWRLAYQSQDTAMKNAGYKLDGPSGYMLPNYYQVGAYYFGMYDQNASQPYLQAAQNFYGRRDPWAGVRDFHGDPDTGVTQNTQGWAGDWSYLKPTIGYYDDSQVSTLETQIDEAATAGLNYFSFYEYWNSQTGTPQIDTGLNSFTQASNTNRMKFMLTPVIAPETVEHLSLPTSQFAAAADAFSNYTTKSNYLTTQDGRPMVYILDVRGIGNGSPTDVNNFIGQLKQAIKNKTGRDAYIMHNADTGLSTVSQYTGDAYTCLNIGQYIRDGSYNEYVNNLGNYFKGVDGSGKPMMRCGVSGFNEAPRTGFWEAKSDVRYFKDDTKGQFPAAMTATRNNMQSQSTPASPIDNYMTMYAWNEWAEGGIIEPNVRDGNYYLNNVQSTFNLTAH